MKLCYLVNQYPKVSHSFIRREILELERRGFPVLRIALRGWDQPLVDAEDIDEQSRTRYILRRPKGSILACFLAAWLRPQRMLRALGQTLSLARRSDKSLAKHLICLVEATVATRWVRSERVTHIHAHFGTNSAEVALLTATLAQVSYSFTVHGPEEFDHPQGLCLGFKVQHASRVMAISSYGRSQLYRWARATDWHKIVVVHCGLDALFLDEPPQASQDANTFACVGRLNEQKGQLLLLDALKIVISRGHACRLALVGDGELRSLIEQRIQQLQLGQHVSITGWVDAGEVRRQILQSRALVLPSFAEGLPVVIMEALASRRPAITTYVAGIPELVKHGENGWLVPAGDVERLAEAMIECLLCDDAKLEKMGADGRARALERHDIQTEVGKLMVALGT